MRCIYPLFCFVAISNAKRTLLGIYHKIKGKYLQLYLDEFYYNLYQRYFGDRLFDRSVKASDYKKAMLLFYEQNNITEFKRIFMSQYVYAVNKYFNLDPEAVE